MTRRLAHTALLVLALAGLLLAGFALTGCVEAPEGPEPMCEVSDDCGSGETCDQGMCWGDPPAGPFAAVLAPPAERTDLVATDIPLLTISAEGDIPDLVFTETITVSGRVLIDCPAQVPAADCDPATSIAAHIWVRRPSDIPGAPDYTRTVDALAGSNAGDDAFTLLLPRLPAGADPYEITVVPEDTSYGESLPPAALAPPVRFFLPGDADDLGVDWVLGAPDAHTWVTGKILDAASRGIPDMQVYLLGRWSEVGDPERSSTIAVTDTEGAFILRVPLAMLDTYELVAKPSPTTVSPTLHAAELLIVDPTSGDQTVDIGELLMPSYPDPASFVLPLLGTGSGGEEVLVAGAEVKLTTILDGGDGVTAVYTATSSSDVYGEAPLLLIPGGSLNRPYLVQVRSNPDSEHASVAGALISIGPGSTGVGYLSGLPLPRRIAVSGTLIDDDGAPVANAQVLARPAVGFAWSLALEVQEFLTNLQPPSTTTDDHGDFLVWLDPEVAGNAALYDLEITPSPGANAPPWTMESIAIDVTGPEALLGRRLGEIRMPPAAYARGTVVSMQGEPIAGATLRVLQIRTDDTICANAIRPLGDVCVPPAIPRGLWFSKDDGQVWIALPDPL